MMMTRKTIYLKIPTFEELSFTEKLLGCKETMSFNNEWGGTVDFPRDKWMSFYDNYINNSERYYFHIYNSYDVPVGEVSTRYDKSFESYVLNIKIKNEFRGNHYAEDALFVFLNYLFDKCGINKMVDNVSSKNKSAIAFLKKMTFKIKNVDNNITLMELHKSEWHKLMKK